MERQNNSPNVTGALVTNVSDRTPDDLAIFSAPGVGVVMHW